MFNVHIDRSTPVCESVSRLTVSLHHMAVGVAHGVGTDVRSARRLTGDWRVEWSRQVRPMGGRSSPLALARRGLSRAPSAGSARAERRQPAPAGQLRTSDPFSALVAIVMVKA